MVRRIHNLITRVKAFFRKDGSTVYGENQLLQERLERMQEAYDAIQGPVLEAGEVFTAATRKELEIEEAVKVLESMRAIESSGFEEQRGARRTISSVVANAWRRIRR